MKLCLIVGGWWKDVRVPNVPICKSFVGYDEIHIIGIEPLNKYEIVFNIINKIREVGDAKIHVHTSKTEDIGLILGILDAVDGLHITVRTHAELLNFDKFEAIRVKTPIFKKLLYLDVYKSVECNSVCFPEWAVVKDVIYEHKHVMNEGEVLLRWENT